MTESPAQPQKTPPRRSSSLSRGRRRSSAPSRPVRGLSLTLEEMGGFGGAVMTESTVQPPRRSSSLPQGRSRSSTPSRRVRGLSFALQEMGDFDSAFFDNLDLVNPDGFTINGQDNTDLMKEFESYKPMASGLDTVGKDDFDLTAYLNDNGFGGFDQGNFTNTARGDADPIDPILLASMAMSQQPRVSLPTPQLESANLQYPDPTQQEFQPYYNLQADANQQQALQPQQNFTDMNLYDLQGHQTLSMPAIPWEEELAGNGANLQQKQILDDTLGQHAEDNELFYTDKNPHPGDRYQSAEYTAAPRSRSSTGTDESERKELKPYRKPIHRGSAYHGGYKPEKPKLCDDKPWVRTNATTIGLTTRTAKINQYTPWYEDRPHPIGRRWVSPSGNEFEYTENFEFSEKTYSASKIQDFIFNYPKDKKTHARLKLWIQKTPTDSARRYLSPWHSKCRFKECPAQLYQTGTILHGHYRVAFDERWHAHGQNVDPFHVAGFAHLYCMERFLDFEAVCKLGIVEVDARLLPHEPKGRFPGTLSAQPEYGIAHEFVDAAMHGDLRREVKQFQNYPVHAHYRRGQQKPHEHTLTYWMHVYKQDSRPAAQIEQFEKRGLKPSHILVNKGNLEVLFKDNIKRKKAVQKAKGKKRSAAHLDDDDENDLVEQARQEARQKIATCSRKKRKLSPAPKSKRSRIVIDDDDDEEDDVSVAADSDSEDEIDLAPKVKGTRQSPRLKGKERKDYAVDVNEQPGGQQQATQAEVYGQNSAYAGYQPATQPVVDDMEYPVFDYDPNDPDFALIQEILQRRSSSASGAVRNRSRGSSVLKSELSARLGSIRPDRRVSIGGVSTRYFDSAAAPHNNALRRSSRVLNGRVEKPQGRTSRH